MVTVLIDVLLLEVMNVSQFALFVRVIGIVRYLYGCFIWHLKPTAAGLSALQA